MFADALADLFARAARGELRVVVGGDYALEDAAQAQIDLRGGAPAASCCSIRRCGGPWRASA